MKNIHRFQVILAAVLSAVVFWPASSGASTYEDALLRDRIESRLQSDSRVQSYDYQVETNDGRIVLRGRPSSLQELTHAVSVALTTEGAESVQTDLNVDAPQVDDQTLRDQAQAILSSTPGQAAAGARIRIENQAAVISGSFPNFAALSGVMNRLSRMEGLRSIRTEAVLAPGVPVKDEYVLESVAKQLSFDRELNADDIRVGVRNGHVWLEGQVADVLQRSRAEVLARYTTGVVGVTNLLTTERGLKVSKR